MLNIHYSNWVQYNQLKYAASYFQSKLLKIIKTILANLSIICQRGWKDTIIVFLKIIIRVSAAKSKLALINWRGHWNTVMEWVQNKSTCEWLLKRIKTVKR